MVVWESSPTRVSGYASQPSAVLFADDHATQILEVDLVADARSRRHDLEVIEALLGPFEKGVALAVAFVFFGHVLDHGIVRAKVIHLDRMIDHQFHRHQRIDLRWITALAWAMASRMAARSTTAGTPVKSCMSTRAG